MIAGPFSPLSFTQAPLFVTTFRPEEWLKKNSGWISEQSQRYGTGLQELTPEALRRTFHPRPHPASTEEEANPSSKGQENLPGGDGVTRIRTSLPPRTNRPPE